jgi:phospholipase/carboxylesterase
MRTIAPLLIVLVACAAACDRAPARDAAPSASAASAPPRIPPPAEPLKVVEIVTRDASPADRLPMLVALHGLGDTAQNFADAFRGLDTPLRLVVLQAPTPYVDGFSWFSLDGDRAAAGPGINAAADRVVAMVRWLERDRPTRGKPMVTGFSQGGAISYALAARYPADFSAAFPLGGWLPGDIRPVTTADALPRLIGFHGSQDVRVDVADGRAAVRAFKDAWGNAEIIEDPEAGHTISPALRLALFRNVREVVATLPAE